MRKIWRWLRWFWHYLKTMCSLAKHQWSNHYNWDQSYLLSLMQWKMKRMRSYHARPNHIIVDGPKVVAQIDEAIDLLEKILNNRFADDLWDKYWEETDTEKASKLLERWVHVANLEEIEAWHKLGKIIENNLPGWWD